MEPKEGAELKKGVRVGEPLAGSTRAGVFSIPRVSEESR
jgi:hypothetical protein